MRPRITRSYWKAYGALYGDQNITPSLPTKKDRSPHHGVKKCLPEDQEQIIAATWLDKNNILYYHVPNGGKRNAIEGAKFKRMGVKPGVPDICIPMPRQGYHGLYIELKRGDQNATTTDNQNYWLTELSKQGYDVYVAHGASALIDYVKTYLGA